MQKETVGSFKQVDNLNLLRQIVQPVGSFIVFQNPDFYFMSLGFLSLKFQQNTMQSSSINIRLR